MRQSSAPIGTPRLPIEVGFVRAVLDLLVSAAKRLRCTQTVNANMHEDKISLGLDREMEKLHRGSQSDIVTWSMRSVRSFPGKSGGTFEVDFAFHANILPRDQRVYLSVEAKRLRGKCRSLAGAYVRKGVLRFVSGKYSLGHDHAVMLGYIVVAPIDRAVARVKRAMDERAADSCQLAPFTAADDLCAHPFTYSSEHEQRVTLQAFRLVHLFVDLSKP